MGVRDVMSCCGATSACSYLKKVQGSSQQRKFAVTHRVLAHAERTVQAIVENSSSRNRETNSASAFLPALAW